MREQPDPPAQRRPFPLGFLVGGLLLALFVGSCVTLVLVPILSSGQDSPRSRAFQVLFSALFALLGLLLVFTERQLRQIGWSRSPVPFVRLLFTTTSGLTFWTGLALLGVALARLEAPASAGLLDILFWTIAGLWLLLAALINILHLLRPRRARAPGRDAGE